MAAASRVMPPGRGLSVILGRAGRSRRRHLLGLDQAHPWRAALSRASTSSGWSARRWSSARCCSRRRRTSSRRCALSSLITSGLRPWPVLRLGLFIYDHLGGRDILPPTRSARSHDGPRPAGRSSRHIVRAFEYSDCWVDDARLVALNARRCRRPRRRHPTRTRCVAARRQGERWRLTARGPAQPGAARDHGARRSSMPPDLGVATSSTEVVDLDSPSRDAAGQGQPHRRRAALRP